MSQLMMLDGNAAALRTHEIAQMSTIPVVIEVDDVATKLQSEILAIDHDLGMPSPALCEMLVGDGLGSKEETIALVAPLIHALEYADLAEKKDTLTASEAERIGRALVALLKPQFDDRLCDSVFTLEQAQ